MDDMLTTQTRLQQRLLWLVLLVILLAACSNGTTPTPAISPTADIPTMTPTPAQPKPTSMPAAAIVNGERIPLTWFESEVDRYVLAQESLGNPVEDEAAAREIVLNDLVDQVLLAQGAREAGATVSDEEVQARIDSLESEVDLIVWMAQWGYSKEDLFQSLKLQILASFQRDFIVESVPEIAEQVRLQQVFAYTETGADNALVSLNSGTTFEEVAFLYDPVAGGHLGWVPRGYLLIPAVEEAAFNLSVGTYSDIIESEIGYHIVLVIDREERPLTNDARLTLQRQALQAWVVDRRTSSTIEVLID
jgi:parvulin-like peptidyl-prolyl isomerase